MTPRSEDAADRLRRRWRRSLWFAIFAVCVGCVAVAGVVALIIWALVPSLSNLG